MSERPQPRPSPSCSGDKGEELRITPALLHPNPASNWSPKVPGERAGSLDTWVFPLHKGSLCPLPPAPSPAVPCLLPWATLVAHGSQTCPPASLISTNPGTPALPQHPLPTSPQPPCLPPAPATCPRPLALTMRHCRSLAPSGCLHCPRCLCCTRQLSRHHCPRDCTCRSPGAAARGPQGAGACRAEGRSCWSPQRVC